MVHTLRPLAVLCLIRLFISIPYESRPFFGLVVTISIKPVVLFGGTDTPRDRYGPPYCNTRLTSLSLVAISITDRGVPYPMPRNC